MNPIISSSIENFGWRNAYLIMAGIVLLLVLPFTLFVNNFKPADIGLKPFGYEENSQVAVSAWGDNFFRQLGNGTDTTSNVPITVIGLNNTTAITFSSC
ncbi:hypothetical protein V7138_14490 [Bacillus sp. JJ1533]|uniref:hypothetical protein n=1 Tax=Bacillus sp. JJ1533 TaxID=3122959 RepID=UPI00300093DC